MVPEEDTGRMREDRRMGQGLADALQRSEMFLMHNYWEGQCEVQIMILWSDFESLRGGERPWNYHAQLLSDQNSIRGSSKEGEYNIEYIVSEQEDVT